ncbi:hypothetical protein Q3G72_007246 [Acer saccharum]|nr:hypothetical protein Q3G72_007246 [Acer saccharum]
MGQKRSRKDGKSVGGGDRGNGGGGGESEHEMHMLIERERRMKMRNMFSSLHALLPQLPPKVGWHREDVKLEVASASELEVRTQSALERPHKID